MLRPRTKIHGTPPERENLIYRIYKHGTPAECLPIKSTDRSKLGR